MKKIIVKSKVVKGLNEMWPSKYDKVKGYIYLAGFEEGRRYERKQKCPDCGSPKREKIQNKKVTPHKSAKQK